MSMNMSPEMRLMEYPEIEISLCPARKLPWDKNNYCIYMYCGVGNIHDV